MPLRVKGKPLFVPQVGESFHLIHDGHWSSRAEQMLTGQDCIITKVPSNGFIVAKCDAVGVTGNYVGWEHVNTQINWHERCLHGIREVGAVSCTECSPKQSPTTKEKQVQIGSSSYALWSGAMRVKDGHVPVIYQGDPEDGQDDSTIFWQGDLTKPYADKGTRGENDFKTGWSQAEEVSSNVLKTFLSDGIEAAAKKVVK